MHPRTKAKLNGEMTYFTGKPCKHGHTSTRITSTGFCSECSRIRALAYHYDNHEVSKQKKRNSYYENKEEYLNRNRKFIEANPEYHKNWRQGKKEVIKATRDIWNKNNKHLRQADSAKRRAAKLQRTPKWLTENDFDIIKREYELAAWCTKVTGEVYHVDHEIPLLGKNVSGLHVPSNLRVIRGSENMSKGNRYE